MTTTRGNGTEIGYVFRMHLELQGTIEAATGAATLPGPGGRRCVLVSSWETGRSFPRTRAGVIPFDLTTAEGRTYRIEPATASARIDVRLREPVSGGYRETGYLEAGEPILVEGEVDEGRPGVVLATLIHQPEQRPCGVAPHRVPPGGLTLATPEALSGPESPQEMLVAEPPQNAETPPPEIEPGVEPPPPLVEPERARPENRPRRRRR